MKDAMILITTLAVSPTKANNLGMATFNASVKSLLLKKLLTCSWFSLNHCWMYSVTLLVGVLLFRNLMATSPSFWNCPIMGGIINKITKATTAMTAIMVMMIDTTRDRTRILC